MAAAYAAQEEGAEVMLIDRGPIGLGSNSALSNGVFGGGNTLSDQEDFIKDTLHVGRGVNNEPLVRRVAKSAPTAFDFLRSLGCAVQATSNFYHVVKPPRPDIIPGVSLVKKLAEVIRGLGRVHLLTGFYVTDILRDEKKAYGVKGFNAHGKAMTIYAPAIVLAMGGAGAVYQLHDNQRNSLGQGYYLSAKMGLQLRDMEFVQFIPVVMTEPHLPRMLLFSPYPEGTRIINGADEDLIEKHGMGDINDVVRRKRDELSILLFQESRKGPIYIDYRAVPPSAWADHPLALLTKKKFDFRRNPVGISPAAHFFMGGVEVDDGGQTEFPGLFACGEIAWGLHGANRRAGNALTECIVLGNLAGRNAIAYASARPSDLRIEEEQNAFVASKLSGLGLFGEIRDAIKRVAWENAGIVRSESGLKEGLLMISKINGRLRAAEPGNMRQKVIKHDLISASFTVRAILLASLARTESRGSFNRSDFPTEDDANWLKNSCLRYSLERDEFYLDHYKVLKT